MFGKRWFGPEMLRERMFGKGDLKYVILDLLQEKPSHGYEIIRAIEEKFGGFYAPSPGAVYPTLQLLEDLGYVTVEQRDSKKVYSITEEGRAFLKQQQPVMEEIRTRMGGWGDPRAAGDDFHDMQHKLREMASAFRHHGRRHGMDPDQARRIREVVSRAKSEIEAILTESPTAKAGARTDSSETL